MRDKLREPLRLSIPHARNFVLCLCLSIFSIFLPMRISKVQDSISILLALQLVIEDCFAIITIEQHDDNNKVRQFINGTLLIYANSFVDEWDNLGKQCKTDNRVVKVRKIANPLIRRIKQWKDLNTFRSTFLAHNFRDSKGNNALIKAHDKELNIPNSFGDFFVLRGCILYAKDILIREFAVEYNEVLPYLKAIKPPAVIKESIVDERQAVNEMTQLIEQCKSIGRNYVK